eukprot:scaffold77395_cov37-Prasinocladus_malaysianus.AAC.1
MDLKRTIQQDFRSAGLYLSSDALKALVSFISSSGGGIDQLDSVIDAVEDYRMEMESSTVSQELITAILANLASGQKLSAETEPLQGYFPPILTLPKPFQIVSAFDVPRYLYDVHRKVFYESKTET